MNEKYTHGFLMLLVLAVLLSASGVVLAGLNAMPRLAFDHDLMIRDAKPFLADIGKS